MPGFMEYFNPDHVCNASDDGARYTYRKQPEICKWNCTKLGEALTEAKLLTEDEVTGIVDEEFDSMFQSTYRSLFRRKLGLSGDNVGGSDQDDDALIADLFETMTVSFSDFTLTFRELCSVASELTKPPTDGGDAEDEARLDALVDRMLRYAAPFEIMLRMVAPVVEPAQLVRLSKLPPGFGCLIQESFMALPDECVGRVVALEMYGIPADFIEEQMRRLDRMRELVSDGGEEAHSEKIRSCWSRWLALYRARLRRDSCQVAEQRRLDMCAVNPHIILRNRFLTHSSTSRFRASPGCCNS